MSTLTCSWLHCLLEHPDLCSHVLLHLIKPRWTLTDDADNIKLCAHLLCTSRSVCRATQPRVPGLLHWYGESDRATTGMAMQDGVRVVLEGKMDLRTGERGNDLEYAYSLVYRTSKRTGARSTHEVRWTGRDGHFAATYSLRPREVGVQAADRLEMHGRKVYGHHLMGPAPVAVRGSGARTTTMAIMVSTDSQFTRWLLAHECVCDTTRVSGMMRSKELVCYKRRRLCDD